MNAAHVKITSPNELSRIAPSPPNPFVDFPILRKAACEAWEAEFEQMLVETSIRHVRKRIGGRSDAALANKPGGEFVRMIHHGDCLEIMPTLPAESVDSIVTDPPYGLSFMGKNWDHGIPGVAFWTEALRVAKPGTHLLAFGGTRTFHRLTCAIEDAGWEIRDCIMWVYGSGFPKSHNLSGEWRGYGTALKPAWEPIIVARKPLAGTVAHNVQEYGTGAVNVDGCRVGTEKWTRAGRGKTTPYGSDRTWSTSKTPDIDRHAIGRWPANLIHDGSDEVMGLFPETTQIDKRSRKVQHKPPGQNGIYGTYDGASDTPAYSDSGSAARFFYCAKASKADRDEGCEGVSLKSRNSYSGAESRVGKVRSDGAIQNASSTESRNHHPTVKPTTLMRYLCRLVTPPGGTVLDPFCGSGSTGKAATLEGFRFIGIEREAEYVEIAKARIAHARGDMPLLESMA